MLHGPVVELSVLWPGFNKAGHFSDSPELIEALIAGCCIGLHYTDQMLSNGRSQSCLMHPRSRTFNITMAGMWSQRGEAQRVTVTDEEICSRDKRKKSFLFISTFLEKSLEVEINY